MRSEDDLGITDNEDDLGYTSTLLYDQANSRIKFGAEWANSKIRFETEWAMVECTRRGPRHAMKSLFKRSSGYLGTSEGCTPLLTAQTRVEEELLPTA